MPNLRVIVLLSFVLALLGACSTARVYPDIPATKTTNMAATDWPSFLPLDSVLFGDLTQQNLTDADVQAMLRRIAFLRKKARILNDPDLTPEARIEKLRNLRRRNG